MTALSANMLDINPKRQAIDAFLQEHCPACYEKPWSKKRIMAQAHQALLRSYAAQTPAPTARDNEIATLQLQAFMTYLDEALCDDNEVEAE